MDIFETAAIAAHLTGMANSLGYDVADLLAPDLTLEADLTEWAMTPLTDEQRKRLGA